MDVVVVSCAWESHIKVAIDAMKAGKPVGMEVGGSYSVKNAGILLIHMRKHRHRLCSWKIAAMDVVN